jgi:hypothetical protein
LREFEFWLDSKKSSILCKIKKLNYETNDIFMLIKQRLRSVFKKFGHILIVLKYFKIIEVFKFHVNLFLGRRLRLAKFVGCE